MHERWVHQRWAKLVTYAPPVVPLAVEAIAVLFTRLLAIREIGASCVGTLHECAHQNHAGNDSRIEKSRLHGFRMQCGRVQVSLNRGVAWGSKNQGHMAGHCSSRGQTMSHHVLHQNKDAHEAHTTDELTTKVSQLTRQLRSFNPRGMSIDNLKKLRRELDEMLQAGEELATKISDAMAKGER